MNDVERDDSAEEQEDFNEVDGGKDAQSDDTECDDAKNSNDEEDNDQVEARKNKPAKSDSKLSCVDQIPNDQFSPIFMSFVVCGTFVDANDRLACFEISDGSTDPKRGRASKIKCEISEKVCDRSHKNSKRRGHITDQMLTSEALQLQQLACQQTTNE